MRSWVGECQAGAAGDRLFLLSHPPVVTYGPRTRPEDLPPAAAGLPMVEVDRGGQATYHVSFTLRRGRGRALSACSGPPVTTARSTAGRASSRRRGPS
jgi:hypothetical protein